jgi:hypothetical protein
VELLCDEKHDSDLVGRAGHPIIRQLRLLR